MKQYPYNEAKQTIQPICNAAHAGEYDTREKFFAVLDQNPHIAIQGYDADGKIHHWNAAATDLYGFREDQALNQDLFDLILPKEMRPLARDMIAAAGKTGRLPESGPCDLIGVNGKIIAVYSGHVMFQWDSASSPEFYCIDMAIQEEPDN